MRRSSAITVTILGALLLTCCLSTGGCGRRSASVDYNWYDKSGNRIEEKWKTDEQGNKLLDNQGRPIPEPHVPYDRYHREWIYQNGAWVPLPPPGGHSSTSRTGGFFLFGGSGYRGGSGSSVGSGGSSISRGGFGTTGGSSSSS